MPHRLSHVVEPGHRHVRLVLQQPMTIPAAARCATGQAAVSDNPQGFPVAPDQHRIYQFSGGFHGSMAELVGTVKSAFR